MIKKVKRKAYAKINLFLETLGKRPDGFTEIRTIFAEIDLFDELRFTLTKNYVIKILSDKFSIPIEENLIYKVAIFIKEKYRVNTGAVIELEKNIPVSAGLGGGSADAAHTILGLNELWDLNLSKSEMHEIAEKFGSDINFFLEGGCALGTGRGEIIQSIENIDVGKILLVNPGIAIAAKEAYQAIQPHTENTLWRDLMKTHNPILIFNRLQEGIVGKYPVVQQCLDILDDNGAVRSIMSGSGSTVIGFFHDKADVSELLNRFDELGYWTSIAKINRSSL